MAFSALTVLPVLPPPSIQCNAGEKSQRLDKKNIRRLLLASWQPPNIYIDIDI